VAVPRYALKEAARVETGFDKYEAYTRAVQSPDEDARFLRKVHRDLVGTDPKVMREDFCGTFALCCAWSKLGTDKVAIGLDLDPEPLAYGRTNHHSALKPEQRARVSVFERNVLEPGAPEADVICALNFSYFIFKDRNLLSTYLERCRASLARGGIMVMDLFGGPACGKACVDRRRLKGLTYLWEQQGFDPITNEAKFAIHFEPRGGRKRKNVFTYDWRLWSIPEIKDLMTEVGFETIHVYWEGTARNGRGNGIFSPRTKGESCDVWVAYVVGVA
jgi:hypothetical protein